MSIRKIGIIPFALSALFLTTSIYADDGYLTIDQILNQAKDYEGIDSSKRSIREGNARGIGSLNTIKDRGGIIGSVKNNNEYDFNGKDGISNNKPTPTVRKESGERDSETVDDIDYESFEAFRVEDFNGQVVGYRNGIPIMCPNPDPLDIHPDLEFIGGETPKISVPIKFRNFDMTLSAYNKTTIKDNLTVAKDFIVSYPYPADGYNDRDEVKALHAELLRKRAFAHESIDVNVDNLAMVEIDDEMNKKNVFEDHSTGYNFIVQILDIDDKNKRLRLRVDYNNRIVDRYIVDRIPMEDGGFKNIKMPIIEERSASKTFYIPIKNREEVSVKIDNKDYIKIKFNGYKYDAARVEIDDLEKIAELDELKRIRDEKLREIEKKKVLDEKLKYFDDVENSIKKL